MKLRLLPAKIALFAMIPALAVTAGVAQGHNDHNQGHQGSNNHGGPPPQNFQFHDQDRNQFQGHYKKDVRKFQSHPGNRPHFERGQRAPDNYRFKPVPASYYRHATPPPPGYQYGYYDGYVVAYDPTTRIIADVLDLVTR